MVRRPFGVVFDSYLYTFYFTDPRHFEGDPSQYHAVKILSRDV